MYKPVSSKVQFPEVEKKILSFWKDEKIFEQSVALHDKEHIFYDGPPFPTGTPHHGSIFVSIIKDSIARFFTMAGYSVPRRWGWDCHGLPIENAVEKEMGIESKQEIVEKIGVKKFNEACRAFVSQSNDTWGIYIDKLGRWVEYENSYRTMDTNYMESVLWVFKESYTKGHIYKDYRVTPYCYHCETSLSISDTRESDSTRPRQDPSVVVRFRLKKDLFEKPTFFLAWTTTPWTLTANLALAVHPEIEYVALEKDDSVVIMAKKLTGAFTKHFLVDARPIKEFKGEELVGMEYQPLFPYFEEQGKQGCFKVLSGDFVTLEDGVGIVHLAPAFGEDDYWLCRKNGIEVQNPVDESGKFDDRVQDFKGMNVHEANKKIIHFLKDQGKVLHQSTIEHNYPHCWRCREPLIYRAMDAWYFGVEKIRAKLIEHNEEITWVPEHVKHGRFGKWLEGARDWNISRSRYWGTPIPIWECEHDSCDHRVVLGSIEEIKKASGILVSDLHKEYLDPITFQCEKCQGTMKRIPEVLDCWFESGSMPYGQCHYPFENKDWFESHYPSDFIVEYPGQIRCWFYYLHVIAVALFDRPAFKNCVVHGTLLAEDGSKISKSKKNYTDPMILLNKYGADAMRTYLLSSAATAMADLQFRDEGITEQIKTVLLPLWNCYSFFVTYANIDQYQGDPDSIPESTNRLDQWILAKLYTAEKEVFHAFSNYRLNKTLNPLIEFLENLTNWYIRRSRDRYWDQGMADDKKSAYDTLYYVLICMVKMFAPSAPFISDEIFKNLTSQASIHLSNWSKVPEKFNDPELIKEIEIIRMITSLGLSLRQKTGIKTRQPLPTMKIALPREIDPKMLKSEIEVLKDELNVKAIEFIDDPSTLATLRAVPNARVLGKRFGKEMQQIIQAARIGNIREEGEKVVIFLEEKEWIIDQEDIKIGYEGKDGMDVASNLGILVVLDTRITDELKEEGISNNLNRVIQDLRKEAGYEISDKIQMSIDGKLESKWIDYLYKAALATPAKLDKNADISKSIKIESRDFTIRIQR